jgi:arylsulfatase A-like enzyme
MNVLVITLDQFRGDAWGAAGHPLVQTPALDALAAAGVRLANHTSQAAPCAPGRACLYTGMYQMNNRVVANGTPLDARFDNLAKAGMRAGYQPVLFGYTDQSVDPREVTDRDDPRRQHYAGVLPGFTPVLHIPDDHEVWLDWLRDKGYTDLGGGYQELAREPQRPAEHSVSAFLTDHALGWLHQQDASTPWFAHLSYLRPHPPRTAAGTYATMYDPADVTLPIEPGPDLHPLHQIFLGHGETAAPTDDDALRTMRAQYYGMISEVDDQLGRVWQALHDLQMWDDTMIVVTADHGDQLGDHGLTGKLGWFEQSFRIIGIIRDPRHPQAHGTVVQEFTENIDIFPTICDFIGVPVPTQCDGVPLTPYLCGETPPWWRTEAHWEFDWRDQFIGAQPHEWPWDRRLERQHVATICDAGGAYAQFGDGSWLAYDLDADPTWRTPMTDPARILSYAQRMLTWRSQHTDRTLTDMLVQDGGVGRMPEAPMLVATPLP